MTPPPPHIILFLTVRSDVDTDFEERDIKSYNFKYDESLFYDTDRGALMKGGKALYT